MFLNLKFGQELRVRADIRDQIRLYIAVALWGQIVSVNNNFILPQ